MKIETLEAAAPWLHLFVGAESDADDLWRSWEASASRPVVRQVRGQKAQTTAALFDEFAAAWQFPWYFGENLDALEECLADLSWLPPGVCVLGIRRAAELLDAEPASARRQFWSVLSRVARGWNGSSPRLRTFRVVLQCLDEEETRLRQRLTEAEVSTAARSMLLRAGQRG